MKPGVVLSSVVSNPTVAVALVLLAAALSGCERDQGADPTPLELAIAEPATFAAFLEEQRGRIVLVDFWATWCVPCREAFPGVVELANKYRERGLVVVSLSLDPVAKQVEVLRFLQRQRATFTHFMSWAGASAQSFEAFDVEGGSVPQYLLYDRAGQLARRFVVDPMAAEQFSHEDIEAEVVRLLGTGSETASGSE